MGGRDDLSDGRDVAGRVDNAAVEFRHIGVAAVVQLGDDLGAVLFDPCHHFT